MELEAPQCIPHFDALVVNVELVLSAYILPHTQTSVLCAALAGRLSLALAFPLLVVEALVHQQETSKNGASVFS